MKFCSKCKSVMIDVAHYEPEGTIPLAMEIEYNSDGTVRRMFACPQCSKDAERELKHGDI